METVDKYMNEGIGTMTGSMRRGSDNGANATNNIVSELKNITVALSQAITRQDERAFKVNLNSLEAMIKQLRKTNLFDY